LLITLSRLTQRRDFLLLVVLLLGLGPTLLTSTDAIHMRSIYALPVLFIIAVRGAVEAVAFVQRQLEQRRLSRGAGRRSLPAWFSAAALLLLLTWHFTDNAIAYFRDWATAESTQRIYNADFRLAARYLDQNAGQDEIFMGTDRLIDLDSETYALYEPLRKDVNWFRLPGNPPLPAGGGAIYLGPTTADIPPVLQLLLDAGAQRDYLLDAQGRSLMWVIRVAPGVLQRVALNTNLRPLDLPVTYESALRLDAVGWQDPPDCLACRHAEAVPGGGLPLLLTQWTALGPWPRTADPGLPLLQPKIGLSISDRSGYRWVYMDVPVKLPVHTARVGQPMLEATTVSLPADMPAGSYLLYLVLYDDKAGPLATTQGAGPPKVTPIAVATLDIALRPLAEAPVPPFDAGDSVAGTPLYAVGRWERLEKLIAGEPADLHVSWRATQQLDTTGLTFRIAAYDENQALLWQQNAPAPAPLPSVWKAGRTLRLTHTVKPEEVAQGAITAYLTVCAEQAAAMLGCARVDGVQVISQPRVIALAQPPQHAVGARWGDSLTLAGYDLSQNGAELALTLYWRAGAAPTGSLKRFVHLLGADDRILAQADESLENNGIPVTNWRNGEYVVDRLQFASPQVPSVQAVCVGLYDAATEERLAVVTASGEAVPDARLCFR
jgi:hypothetical protein